MGMKPDEIKLECEAQYEKIKEAEGRLEELRKICKHEETFVGNYSWRPGVIEEAKICSSCGSLVEYPWPIPTFTQTKS